MKRRRPHARHRASRDTERLAWLAQGLADARSRLEIAWWEAETAGLIEKLLKAGDEEVLNQTLDRLQESRAYDDLADLIEAACETRRSVETDLLLVALPVLAWSRYAIPTRNLPDSVLDAVRTQLCAHVLAADARVVFADYLFSPDQLPQGYGETRQFAETLWDAAAAGMDLKVDDKNLSESQLFVSDVRYLIAAVRVAAGRPIFRWNEADGSRRDAEIAWSQQGGPNFQSLLPGCAFEALLPDAYFAAWRLADQKIRPFALTAAVAYLQTLFNVPATRLRAVAAPYYERWPVEWRIGFTLTDSDEVVHGVIWPLLGNDEDNADLGSEIEALLKATGIGQVRLLDTRMPLEYCEDCGAPLFPNPDGENVHAELPEDMQGAPEHLH